MGRVVSGNPSVRGRSDHAITEHSSLIVARDGLDGIDDFFVGDVVGDACEGSITPVGEQGRTTIRVAAERGEQLTTFGVVEGSEVHEQSP